jgi:hypothetical protein
METTNPNFKIERSFAYSGGDQNGEPIAIHIIKSNWTNPDLYHVIIEFGDYDSADHHLLSKEQIQEKFGIELGEDSDFGKMVHNMPNDMELGKAMRLEYIKNKS